MDTTHKSLLVRADFTLDPSRGGDRLTFKRWRRVLADALPRLMRLGDRCSGAVLRFHEGAGEVRFSLWLRLPLDRLPGRKRLGRIKGKLRDRLASVLLPLGGVVVKLGVRRYRPRPTLLMAPQAKIVLPFVRAEQVTEVGCVITDPIGPISLIGPIGIMETLPIS